MLAKRVVLLANGTKVDLMSGSTDGSCQVTVWSASANVMISSDSGADEALNVADINSASSGKRTLVFNWDTSVPLYAWKYGGGGDNAAITYIISPVGDTNVNLSLGTCS